MAVRGFGARRALACVAVVVVAGCGGPGHGGSSPSTAGPAGTASASGPPVTIHLVMPPALVSDLPLVGEPAGWNGDLVVFLAGTGDEPSCCQLFLTEAADLGFHVIGLSYDNATAVATRCGNDLSCYGVVHQDVFTGIERGLVAVLSYLQRAYPREGWGRFLSGGLPRYGSIVLAGHSQGGAEAAFIATRHDVAGVVMLSAPPDTGLVLRPATWLAGVRTGKTPLSRYFGFIHSGDPYAGRISADWKAMGLAAFGPLTSVDGARAPYGESHELISAAPLPQIGVPAAHDGTAVDSAQPLCPDATPAYAAVWAYLLQSAAGLSVSGPTVRDSGTGCRG